MAVQDFINVLNGKWKIAVISSICLYNKRPRRINNFDRAISLQEIKQI